jgi:hypothetical protein
MVKNFPHIFDEKNNFQQKQRKQIFDGMKKIK